MELAGVRLRGFAQLRRLQPLPKTGSVTVATSNGSYGPYNLMPMPERSTGPHRQGVAVAERTSHQAVRLVNAIGVYTSELAKGVDRDRDPIAEPT